ncbi:MAG: bifunctional UDP-N-acetylglucosamine diphosphorylase/glucosamine-1-phosphate N-acetyltransferase GlmU [Acidimicrobiales bacterium]
MSRPLSALVLAAGEGTRMRSTLAKPLHRLCGRPMILHVVDALAELTVAEVVVVVGRGADDLVRAVLDGAPAGLKVRFVEQDRARGTGDAVAVGLTALDDDFDEGEVVVLPGDTPLLRPPTLAALVRRHRGDDSAATLLVAEVADPTGYGRVVRGKDGGVAAVVEEADAEPEQLLLREVNTSIYCFRRGVLAPSLRRLEPQNAQREYYLTDTVAVLAEAGYRVDAMVVADPVEAAGVNDRAQLAAAEAELRSRINERWMRRGVTMVDPDSTYLDASVELEAESILLPGVMLAGSTTVGRGARIGPGCQLVDTTVGEDAEVRLTDARSARIGPGAQVGPYAALGPGATVARDTRTGPFFVGGVGAPESGERSEGPGLEP